MFLSAIKSPPFFSPVLATAWWRRDFTSLQSSYHVIVGQSLTQNFFDVIVPFCFRRPVRTKHDRWFFLLIPVHEAACSCRFVAGEHGLSVLSPQQRVLSSFIYIFIVMLLLTLSAPARFQTLRCILEFSKEAEDLFCPHVRCCFVRQIATVTEVTWAKQGVTFAYFRVKYQLTLLNVAVTTHVFQSRFPVG